MVLKDLRKDSWIFTYVKVPILVCSPEGGSHLYGNLPYNIQLVHFLM